MLNIAKRQILPASVEYSSRLGRAVSAVANAGVSAGIQKKMLKKVCSLIKSLDSGIEALEKSVQQAGAIGNSFEKAEGYYNCVIPAMRSVRQAADELEKIVDADLWPLPSYPEMLFLK